MGNWRTIHIEGTMSAEDAAKLRELLDDVWRSDAENVDQITCLSFDSKHPGLCGLGAWPSERMSRTGNLYERDYTVQDVADALTELVKVAPSMLLQVHCGDEYESEECVASVAVDEGVVAILEPAIAKIPEIPQEQVQYNLLANLFRG